MTLVCLMLKRVIRFNHLESAFPQRPHSCTGVGVAVFDVVVVGGVVVGLLEESAPPSV